MKEGEVTNINDVTVIKSKNYDCDIWVYKYDDRQVYEFKIEGSVFLRIEDKFGSNNYNFTRIIKNQTFIIYNGEIIFKTVEKPCKFINKIGKDKKLRNNL